MFKNKNIPFLVLTLLIIVGLIVFSYFSLRKSQLLREASNTQSIPTSYEVIYKSSDGTYEFENQAHENCGDATTIVGLSEPNQTVNVNCGLGLSLIQIVTEKSDSDPLEWYLSKNEYRNFYEEFGVSKKTTFAGKNATEIVFDKKPNDYTDYKIILVNTNSQNYQISSFFGNSPDKWQGALADKILSTFKFTN